MKKLFNACLLALAACGAAPAARAQSWYVESASAVLDPANRYVGTLVATNPGALPVYVRASVFTLEARDGARRQGDDVNHLLNVYPNEFVLQPRSSFSVRLVADAGRFEGVAQSFYVRLRDVSDASAQGAGSGMAGNILLAYDVLVAASRKAGSALEAASFELVRDGAGGPLLFNRSAQHVFLQEGYACADARRTLAQCEALAGFSRRSLLPQEAVRLPDAGAPYLGLLLQPTLAAHSRPQALFIPVPGAVAQK